MLSTYKKLYEQCADAIPGWRDMNKNDLVNKYIEVENTPELANSYLSAIICRYWGALNKYYALSGSTIDKTTYYNWLIDAILYSIKHRKWKDPANKLYNDPNAPDKVINRVIMSERDIFYQEANTRKRRQGFNNLSLEALQEDNEDSFLPIQIDETDIEGTIDIQSLIRKALDQGDYLTALIIDTIVNYNVFDREKDTKGRAHISFNDKRLRKLLRTFDKSQCEAFAEAYGVDVHRVEAEVASYRDLPSFRFKKLVTHNMNKLHNHYKEVKESI